MQGKKQPFETFLRAGLQSGRNLLRGTLRAAVDLLSQHFACVLDKLVARLLHLAAGIAA